MKKYALLGDTVDCNIMIDNTDSSFEYSFNEVSSVLKKLNNMQYKGFTNWRLPTIQEIVEFGDLIVNPFAFYYMTSTIAGPKHIYGYHIPSKHKIGLDFDHKFKLRLVRNNKR